MQKNFGIFDWQQSQSVIQRQPFVFLENILNQIREAMAKRIEPQVKCVGLKGLPNLELKDHELNKILLHVAIEGKFSAIEYLDSYEMDRQGLISDESKLIEYIHDLFDQLQKESKALLILKLDDIANVCIQESTEDELPITKQHWLYSKAAYQMNNHSAFQLLIEKIKAINPQLNFWVIVVSNNRMLSREFIQHTNWPLSENLQNEMKRQVEDNKERICKNCDEVFTLKEQRSDKDRARCTGHTSNQMYSLFDYEIVQRMRQEYRRFRPRRTLNQAEWYAIRDRIKDESLRSLEYVSFAEIITTREEVEIILGNLEGTVDEFVYLCCKQTFNSPCTLTHNHEEDE